MAERKKPTAPSEAPPERGARTAATLEEAQTVGFLGTEVDAVDDRHYTAPRPSHAKRQPDPAPAAEPADQAEEETSE